MITTITLNAAADLTYLIPGFRKNEINRIQQVFKEPGGKGVNAAKVLHALQIPVTAAGFAGGENGRFIVDSLLRRSIDSRFTEIEDESRACHSIADPGCAGIQTELLEKGPEITPAEWHRFLEKDLTELAAESQYVLFSGSLPGGLNEDSYIEAAERAAAKGARIIFDTGGKTLEKALQTKPFLIKPNLGELGSLFGRDYDAIDVKEIAKDVKAASDGGANAVALTLGSRGSIFHSKGITLFATAPKVHAVNPTGCGDAFLAGFTAALYKGRCWKEAIISGTAAGAANAMEWTAGTVRIENYEHIKHTVQVYNL
ncbi:1-phosphofructokinase family hexose kinase [Bacillus sp. SJS]|uniref:1-phosphofructokinase family hexose kinase n=1 Tax=Bacillus sp. SJS TaxID=1423321 RepID=UPI0004DD73F9|nr:1-phosphofructokinase family hexose kinase [Bacillus sp. SJS]KZZ86050.1 hypothetical protein AS29_002390 [Bacillus sp. SJS]